MTRRYAIPISSALLSAIPQHGTHAILKAAYGLPLSADERPDRDHQKAFSEQAGAKSNK